MIPDLSEEDLKKMKRDELEQALRKVLDSPCVKDCQPIHPDISFRDLVENAQDIMFVIDEEGRLIYHNQAWNEVFSSTDEIPLGDHYSKYIIGIDLDRAEYVFDSVINKGLSFQNEILRFSTKKVEKRVYSLSISPITGDQEKISGLLGMMKDVTLRYLAEKKLKENTSILEKKVKEQLQQQDELRALHTFSEDIVRNAPIGIFMLDPSGVMIQENPKLKEIMGHGDETRIGVNILEYEGFIESGFDVLFEECVTKKQPVIANNRRYVPISRDRELVVTMHMFPIVDKNGNIDRVVVMVEDTTEAFSTNQQINNTQRKAVIGTFAGGISEDIRQSVNRMIMDLNFVANNIDSDSPAQEYTDNLKEQLERLKNVSDELIALSITDETEKEVFDLRRVFREHPMTMLLSSLENRGINLHMNIPEEELWVMATPAQLHNVFRHIIKNGAEAIQDKGDISIRLNRLVEDRDRYILVEISDTGVGINEENIKEIFKPFYTTKGKQTTGLGLMIVCFILDNLKGTLGIKSEPGAGTTIRVALPEVQDRSGGPWR
jgi:PAS domain S-box-containing protein